VISVPLYTSRVDFLIWSDDFACSVEQVVTLVALLADSNVLVEEFTLGRNLAADAFYIEVVVI